MSGIQAWDEPCDGQWQSSKGPASMREGDGVTEAMVDAFMEELRRQGVVFDDFSEPIYPVLLYRAMRAAILSAADTPKCPECGSSDIIIETTMGLRGRCRSCGFHGSSLTFRAKPAAADTDGQTHLHLKSGHLVREIGRGFAQVSIHPIEEMSAVVIYEHAGKMWVRNAVEFDDGRFEKLDKPFVALGPDAADTGLVERLTLRDVANAINRARYTPYGMLVRDVEDEDKSGYEYAYRLAVAAFDLFTTAAEQREAAAREQIAALTEAVLDAETWLEALVTDAAPGSEDSTHEVIKTITKLKAARAVLTLARETNDGQ